MFICVRINVTTQIHKRKFRFMFDVQDVTHGTKMVMKTRCEA
jgi:hypothetical protein